MVLRKGLFPVKIPGDWRGEVKTLWSLGSKMSCRASALVPSDLLCSEREDFVEGPTSTNSPDALSFSLRWSHIFWASCPPVRSERGLLVSRAWYCAAFQIALRGKGAYPHLAHSQWSHFSLLVALLIHHPSIPSCIFIHTYLALGPVLGLYRWTKHSPLPSIREGFLKEQDEEHEGWSSGLITTQVKAPRCDIVWNDHPGLRLWLELSVWERSGGRWG